FRLVTLPLLVPGLISATLLIFIRAMADFGTPMLVGGNFQTLAPAAYLQVVGLYDVEMAAVLCIVLLVPCLLLYFLHDFLLRRISYATITGSSTYSEVLGISGLAKWALFNLALVVGVVNFLQYSFVVIGSFAKFWGHDYSFTLNHYSFAWKHGLQPLLNSVLMAIPAAAIGAFLGIFIAYFIVRERFFGRQLLDFTTAIPSVVPGTVVGIGYILAFHHPPLLLTGTFIILIISCIFRFLPVGYKVGMTNLEQIEQSIEEASLNLGAGWLTTFSEVILPLMRPAFLVGFIYIFMMSMTTLSAVIFLLRPGTKLMAVSIFKEAHTGNIGAAAALSTLLIVIVTICLAVINKFGKIEQYERL
ncbi:iron ABC transporter permease, partial [Candidatus Oleimmundimicrobium sp.]|uniref:ABC transporter permease n=1 Tax=Candidatus Oleimmundimicrobium sp. TaxID=3060597 RepID=UPI00271FC473